MHPIRPAALLLAACVATASCADSNASDPALLRACRAELAQRAPGWTFAKVPAEAAAAARARGQDPITTYGDFDDDGREDVAMLVALPDGVQIAACLARDPAPALHMIERPHCSDLIAQARKGQAYAQGAAKQARYPRDGIRAQCYEKPGATYLFDAGRFRAVIDAD